MIYQPKKFMHCDFPDAETFYAEVILRKKK